MNKFLSFVVLLIGLLVPSFASADVQVMQNRSGVLYKENTNLFSANSTLLGNAITPSAVANAVSGGTAINYERLTLLYSNSLPWRVGAWGDSLGDDVVGSWIGDFARGLGWNGGYLTVTTNSVVWPLTYTFSGNVTFAIQDTNWFTEHFTCIDSSDVTFDSGGRFIGADTFRGAVVYSTNGGTYKWQVSTNGGAFTDVTATSNALAASVSANIFTFGTNLGEWKLKFVNVTGTNVLIGGGLWASNRGGISPSALYRSGGAITDITNVSTNILIPVLTSLGLTESIWQAADYAVEVTNSLPFFCNLLTNVAPNKPATFIGLHNVTENAPGYPLGNKYIRGYVEPLGFRFIDTEVLGDTNTLIRRQWVTDGGAVHWSTLGQYFVADLVWNNGSTSAKFDSMLVSSLLGNRTPFIIAAGPAQLSNLLAIVSYYGTNLFSVAASGATIIGGERLVGSGVKLDVNGSVTVGVTNLANRIDFIRLNNAASLYHQIQFDNANPNTASLTYERDSGRVTLNSAVGIHMEIDADNNQTGNYFSVDKDAANNTNAVNLFKVQENGAVSSVAGLSASNAFHGGTIFYSLSSFTNLNAVPGTLTNLGNYSVPGHCLTNNGDQIIARWGGRMPLATANTNNFQITYGGTTVLDTGLQTASNTTFTAELTVTRSGVSAQHVEATFSWGPGGAVPYAFTNVNTEMTIDAGIAAVVALKGSAQIVGAHTNNSFRVIWNPGPK